MKVLICSDSFKGSLTSKAAGAAMANGVLTVEPTARIIVMPVGDGGEGTVEAVMQSMQESCPVKWIECAAVDAMGSELTAKYAIAEDREPVAFIEMAAASGLTLISPDKRDIIKADTYGTGLMIGHAYRLGIRNFMIGMGGSATCDAGQGALKAIYSLHHEFGHPPCGPLLPDAHFKLLCDVRNPLCGPQGSAYVFSPQKGAGPADIELLEDRNRRLAHNYTSYKGLDVAEMPYAGAAGGLAGMLMACCDATLVDGIEEVLDIIGFDNKAADCELIITGEGRMDTTTLSGKTPSGILKRALRIGVPVAAIGGEIRDREMLEKAGFDIIEQSTPRGVFNTVKDDEEKCAEYVKLAAAKVMKRYKTKEYGKDSKL